MIYKNRTTFGELMDMPFNFVHTLYYKAWKSSQSEEGKKIVEGEQMEETLGEMMGG